MTVVTVAHKQTRAAFYQANLFILAWRWSAPRASSLVWSEPEDKPGCSQWGDAVCRCLSLFINFTKVHSGTPATIAGISLQNNHEAGFWSLYTLYIEVLYKADMCLSYPTEFFSTTHLFNHISTTQAFTIVKEIFCRGKFSEVTT